MASTDHYRLDDDSRVPEKPYIHPPPNYSRTSEPKDSKISLVTDSLRESKISEKEVSYGSGPWLLRRTSIVVESEAANPYDDNRSISQASHTKSTRTDRGGVTKHLFRKNTQPESIHGTASDSGSLRSGWHDTKPFDTGFGTKVLIEAGRPKKIKQSRHHEMKGLEQAASVKRWAGNGCPGEAWGKLMKDPELWDPNGDTLVYFGYQRPQPSFRIRSAMIEDVGSEILTSKLQEGRRRPGKAASVAPSNSSSERSIRGARAAFSRTDSAATGVTFNQGGNDDPNDPSIRYNIHFPAPTDGTKVDILRYHITTRNFFALLLARPLVGLTFYQALVDLHQRTQLYMPGDPNCALILIKCLMENNLHNVSNDPAAAAGLLAWSEDEEVCWQEGWREGFVHCSGMFARLQKLPEFRDVSHTSRALLERAYLERQVRVQETEDRLVAFEFNDMWPDNTQHLKTIRTSFDHFRRFLRTYYEKAYKTWPPKLSPDGDGSWLTRAITTRLQRDFDALYDYFVDKDIVWTPSTSQHRGQAPIHRKPNRHHEDGSSSESDYFLADIFKRFDQKYKHTPIPHPYPLFPHPISAAGKSAQKSSLFTSKSKTLEKRVAHAYAEASNLPVLQTAADFASNGLVDAFIHFEKTDHPNEAEPRAARKGRWMLLYGILQVLARVSVDTPDLYFAASEVGYFLNSRLKGCPPWNYGDGIVYEDAGSRMAHVWRDYADIA